MKEEIQAAISVLVGKDLWRCCRAADMATFQFGGKIKAMDRRGHAKEVGEFALHVQCAWRITQGEKVVVGSRDLHYSPDLLNEETPVEFDWDKGPNRRDELIRLLFENGRQFMVQGVEALAAGGLQITFNDLFSLDVFPYHSLSGEHWRLLVPGNADRHFVVTGKGIET